MSYCCLPNPCVGVRGQTGPTGPRGPQGPAGTSIVGPTGPVFQSEFALAYLPQDICQDLFVRTQIFALVECPDGLYSLIEGTEGTPGLILHECSTPGIEVTSITPTGPGVTNNAITITLPGCYHITFNSGISFTQPEGAAIILEVDYKIAFCTVEEGVLVPFTSSFCGAGTIQRSPRADPPTITSRVLISEAFAQGYLCVDVPTTLIPCISIQDILFLSPMLDRTINFTFSCFNLAIERLGDCPAL